MGKDHIKPSQTRSADNSPPQMSREYRGLSKVACTTTSESLPDDICTKPRQRKRIGTNMTLGGSPVDPKVTKLETGVEAQAAFEAAYMLQSGDRDEMLRAHSTSLFGGSSTVLSQP